MAKIKCSICSYQFNLWYAYERYWLLYFCTWVVSSLLAWLLLKRNSGIAVLPAVLSNSLLIIWTVKLWKEKFLAPQMKFWLSLAMSKSIWWTVLLIFNSFIWKKSSATANRIPTSWATVKYFKPLDHSGFISCNRIRTDDLGICSPPLWNRWAMQPQIVLLVKSKIYSVALLFFSTDIITAKFIIFASI